MLTFNDVKNSTLAYEQLKKKDVDEIVLYYFAYFDADIANRKNVGHAWNEVKIGSKWYSCDFTSDMPTLTFGILKLYFELERIRGYFIDKIKSQTIKRMIDFEIPKVELAGVPLKRKTLASEGLIQEQLETKKQYSELSNQELYANYAQIAYVDVSLDNIISAYDEQFSETSHLSL